MSLSLRPMEERDIAAILDLSILAWAPVFESFQQVLGRAIFTHIYPDWPANQRAAVESVCRDPGHTTWVAEREGAVAGFVSYKLDEQEKVGEVEMLAVHPDHQRRGVGTALNRLALERLRAGGMTLAVVGTGGDPGHAPARAAYEKVGYTPLPIVRYYQMLDAE